MYPEWMTNTLGTLGETPAGTGGPGLGQLGERPAGAQPFQFGADPRSVQQGTPDNFGDRFGQWQPTMSASGVLPATQPDPAAFAGLYGSAPPGTGGSMLGPAAGPGVPYINQSMVPGGAATNPADLQRQRQGPGFMARFFRDFDFQPQRPGPAAEPFKFSAPRQSIAPIGRQRGVMSRQGYA